MAIDYGKLNFSVSFNPTSAFPIDARCYFESLADAERAAATAEYAGSSNTIYYYGQNIVVVENNTASFYIIQPDGTLGQVGGTVEISDAIFEYNADKELTLLGFENAETGAQLTKSADGTLQWIKPDATTIEGVQTELANLQTTVSNMYTKTQTDTAISTAIANSQHLSRVIVESLDDIDTTAANADTHIYMVSNGLSDYDNKYDEYVIIDGVLEKVGNWSINLENYATLTDLAKKVDKEEGKSLIATTDIEKLAGIEAGAQKNFITSVDNADFTVTNGNLALNPISISKVENLSTLLNNKVDKVEGKGLSTNDFTDTYKNKIDNLPDNLVTVVSELDKVVFGYVNEETTETVIGLDDRVGSLENNFSTINTKVLNLENSVGDLKTSVSNIPNTYVSKTAFKAVVGDIDLLIAQSYNVMNEIDNINTRLSWQDL